MLTILLDQHDGLADDDGDGVPADQVRTSLQRNRDLVAAFDRAWPLVEAGDLVGDLWSVPAYLRRCAPELGPDQVRLLQRAGRPRGRSPTSRCSTPPGSASATRRRSGAAGSGRPRSPPSARGWPTSSTS